MHQNTKAAVKLYMLVCIMALFLIGVGVLGTVEMKKMSLNTRSLHADRLLPLQQLTEIRYSYATGILATAEKLENKDITLPEAQQRLALAVKTIGTNWTAYQKTLFTTEESALVKQTGLLKAKADAAISAFKEKIQAATANTGSNFIDEKLYAAIDPLINNINELVQLQILISSNLTKTNEGLYYSSAKKIYGLISGCLIFAGLLAFYIIGDTRKLITDLKSSNIKIKEAEEKYRAFVKYAGDSILILNHDLQITDANNSACSLFGYSLEELIDTNIADLMPLEEQALLPQKVNLIKQAGTSLHERKWQRKDGSVVDTEVNVKVLQGVGYISVIRDITERKKIAQAILESEEKYRYLFQNSPACIIIWNLETLAVLEVNDAVADKYGYSREDWENMTVLQYRPVEDYAQIKAFAKSMLEGNRPVSRMRWRHLKKNGEEMLMEIVSHKIIYTGQKAILSLGIDITDLVRAETALSKSEDKFHSLVDHAPDAIFMVADNGVIFDVNYSAIELLQYSKQELIGKTVLDLHPPEVREGVPLIWEVLRKNKFYADARWLQKKDGSKVEVEITRNMLPDGTGAIAIVRDITDRKRAEEALIKSHEQYTQLFNNMLNGLMVCELIYDEHGVAADHRFVQGNPAFERLTGLSIKAQLGKTGKDLAIGWPPDITQMLYRVALTGEPVEYERFNETLGKTYATRVFSPRKGTFAHTFTDITEKKLAEEKLIQSEEKHRALIENISDGILLIDETWNITYQSPSVERIVGFTLEDRKGKTALDFIHPDDLQLCEEQYKMARDKPGTPIQNQYRSRHKRGGYIWIEVFILNLLHIKSVNAYVIVYRDITERKKFEEQQLLMTLIVNSSNDAIISKTLNGTITSWNNGAEKVLGFSAADMIGKNISAIIPFNLIKEEEEILIQIKSGKSIDHYETKRVKKSGEIINVSLTISPIQDAAGNITGASKILRDITKEKESEERLATQNRELLKTNAELDRFVYCTSHDLRAPLKSLLGLINIMQKTAPIDDKVQKQRLDMMQRSVVKLDAFIEDILLYSRNSRQEISVDQIIFEEMVGEIKKAYEQTYTDVKFEVLIHQDAIFFSDKQRLNIVLNNIVCNAVKYKDKLKGVASFVKIEVQCSQQDAVISIEDNGIGIAPEDHEKIFEMFYRATTISTGAGLGMYIIKEVLEKLNGTIKVKSALGEGTNFFIVIPNKPNPKYNDED